MGSPLRLRVGRETIPKPGGTSAGIGSPGEEGKVVPYLFLSLTGPGGLGKEILHLEPGSGSLLLSFIPSAAQC